MPKIPFSPVPEGPLTKPQAVNTPAGPVVDPSPLSAGFTAVTAAVNTKLNANAAVRGTELAEHDIQAATTALETYKRQHLQDPKFDEAFLKEMGKVFGDLAKDHTEGGKSAFASGTEELYYKRRVAQWQTHTFAAVTHEATKAFLANETERLGRVLGEQGQRLGVLRSQFQGEPYDAETAAEQKQSHTTILDLLDDTSVVAPQLKVKLYNTLARDAAIESFSRDYGRMSGVIDEMRRPSTDPKSAPGYDHFALEVKGGALVRGEWTRVPFTDDERKKIIKNVLEGAQAQQHAQKAEREIRAENSRLTLDSDRLTLAGFVANIAASLTPSEAEGHRTAGIKYINTTYLQHLRQAGVEGDVPTWLSHLDTAFTHRTTRTGPTEMLTFAALREKLSVNPGSVTMHEIAANRAGLSPSQVMELVSQKAAASLRQGDHAFEEFEKRRGRAYKNLQSWFNVPPFLALDNAARSLWASAETEFNTELDQARRTAANDPNDPGAAVAKVNPEEAVFRVLQKNFIGYATAIMPSMDAAAKSLSGFLVPMLEQPVKTGRPAPGNRLDAMEILAAIDRQSPNMSVGEKLKVSLIAAALETSGMNYGELRDLLVKGSPTRHDTAFPFAGKSATGEQRELADTAGLRLYRLLHELEAQKAMETK
ncbi:hypothetical protein [Caudoviricetes sp.]|nr:hypothetical protein [Caudoviricetes sp.]UOF79657.1 hypothetical protein [Caudoviricetes sp.]UOF79868.1 hypothetical protein [Bacteriophage sp.]UOF81328.1 hypothetical protein [Caudoviricetes sp.]